MVQHYVVFDFETTGFSPQKNEIIQIGAVKYNDMHQEIGRFNQLIKPTRSHLPTKISWLLIMRLSMSASFIKLL